MIFIQIIISIRIAANLLQSFVKNLCMKMIYVLH